MKLEFILFALVCLLLWMLLCKPKEKFTSQPASQSLPGCGRYEYKYPPWPSSTDCGGWVKFLSNGYPTIPARGNQALLMTQGQGWETMCSSDEFDELASNAYAYSNGLIGDELDVATVVEAVKSSGMTKKELCGIATVITTPPPNMCQEDDWKTNYMSTMNPSIQSTLNEWLTYC